MAVGPRFLAVAAVGLVLAFGLVGSAGAVADGPHAPTSGATHDRLKGPLAVTTPDGLPSVLYLDGRTGAIRQATWTGGGWHLSPVERHAVSAVAAVVS